MKYLTVCSNSYVDKNKLETEIKGVFNALDRDVKESKEEIEDLVAEIAKKANARHPRCKPFELSVWCPGDTDDILLHGLGMSVRFYAFDKEVGVEL